MVFDQEVEQPLRRTSYASERTIPMTDFIGKYNLGLALKSRAKKATSSPAALGLATPTHSSPSAMTSSFTAFGAHPFDSNVGPTEQSQR